MLKILIKILIFSLFFMSSISAEQIKNIEVSGNQRISKETILVLGNIDKNQDFNNDKLNNSLKKLYDTNFFSDIKMSLSNGLLTIRVDENPIIEDIEITGIKNKSFLEKIYENIVLKNRVSFTEDQLKKDIVLIKNVLKTNGYYFAKLKSSIIPNKSLNSIRLKLDIDQGEKARIKKIIFIGDKNIKDKKLLEVIASEEHKFWKFVSDKVYLNQSIIELDKRLLKNYYRNQGYHKVKVLNSFAEFNDKGFFKLIFNIDSGKQYYFNNLKINLPDNYKRQDFKKVEKIFKKLKGKRYSLDSIKTILDEIDKIASARLYDFISAKVEETIYDDNKIDFTFNVADSDKFYVERINILGNFNTIEEVVRNKFIVDEGDPLNTLLYNKSLEQIRALGIFRFVRGEIENGSNENLKVINLTVEEKPTGEISLSAGVGTNGTSLGAGIKERNFLGKGINLTTNFELSDDSVTGQFVYSKPNFAYTDNTLFTSIKSTSTDLLETTGYKQTEFGFSVGTEYEQYENLFFSPELDFSIEDLKTDTKASSALKSQEGTYEDFYFNYGLIYDLRNSPYRPSSGSSTAFRQELPVVSGNNEIANTLTYSKYKSLNKSKEMIGKASFYFKAINSLDNSNVRISKRAQMPSNRLRGFIKGKVGPVDNSDYIGGNYVSALNLSTNLPGILPTFENIDLSYFIDFGNVWGVDYDSNLDDSNGLRSSTGIGLDFLTPIGPLSFSLTQPLIKKSTDKTETFRFNLGTTF